MIGAPSCGSKVVSLAFAALLVAGVSLRSAAPGEAASSANYFLKIRDIPGEATSTTTTHHSGEIEVLNFSMNFSQAVPCGQLLIVKYIDKASPVLVRNMLMGSILPEAILTGEALPDRLVAARQQQQQSNGDFFKLILQQVKILTLAMQDNSGAPPAIEQVTLSASVVTVEYTPVTNKGTVGGDLVSQVINCTR